MIKVIDDFTNTITVKNISLWLKEIVVFIIKPIRFKNDFYSRNLKSQVYQILFYSSLNILAYFTFGAGQSYKESLRLLFLIAIIAFPFIIINSISFFIIKRNDFKFWNITSYVLISSLIFIFPILILEHFFLETENYTFKFLSNICLLLSITFNLFIIYISFFKSLYKIAIGFFLNILVLNILFILIGLIIKDSYSKSSIQNSIFQEYNSYATNLKGLTGHPYNYIEITDIHHKSINEFIGYAEGDSIQYYDNESMEYIKTNAKKNFNYLDSIIPKLHFKRNKEIFTELKMHFKSFKKYFDSKPCDTCLIKKTFFKNSINDSVFAIKNEYLISKNYTEHYKKFNSKISNLIKLEEYAHSPNRILEVLFYPTKLISYLFGLEKKGSVSIILK